MKRPTFEEAKRLYVHRYTLNHIPQWARKPCEGNGKYYAPHYSTDVEWFNNCKFYGDEGFYGRRGDSQSGDQSWPMGKWLDEPIADILARGGATWR